MDKTLFIGNGLNRAMNNNISWDELLNYLSEINNVFVNNNIPLPLKFECLINKDPKSAELNTGIYDNYKEEFVKKIEEKDFNLEFLRNIDLEKYQSIITTNYDLNIEKCFNLKRKSIHQLTKYYEENVCCDEKIKVFHPHGISTNIKTICLGYEHYCGIIERCRDKFKNKCKENSKKYIENLLDGKLVIKYWYDNFFVSDVYMIGFGLGLSKIDMWWLLSYRASILSTNRDELKDKVKNKIIYYDINLAPLNDERQMIHNMLESMFVIVRNKEINDLSEYYETYKNILLEINKEASNGNQ